MDCTKGNHPPASQCEQCKEDCPLLDFKDQDAIKAERESTDRR
jgi:hypothetical protein